MRLSWLFPLLVSASLNLLDTEESGVERTDEEHERVQLDILSEQLEQLNLMYEASLEEIAYLQQENDNLLLANRRLQDYVESSDKSMMQARENFKALKQSVSKLTEFIDQMVANDKGRPGAELEDDSE